MLDSADGTIMGMRILALDSHFTARLHSICREMDQRRPLGEDFYKKKVERLYAQYPDSEALARSAYKDDRILIRAGN